MSGLKRRAPDSRDSAKNASGKKRSRSEPKLKEKSTEKKSTRSKSADKSKGKKSAEKLSTGKRSRSESKSTGKKRSSGEVKKRKVIDDEASDYGTPMPGKKRGEREKKRGRKDEDEHNEDERNERNDLTNEELLKDLEWDLFAKAKSHKLTVKEDGRLFKNKEPLILHPYLHRAESAVKLLYGVGHPVIVEDEDKTNRLWVRIKRDGSFEQADEMHLFVSNKAFLKYLSDEIKSHSPVSGHAQRLLDENPVITFHPHSNDTDDNLHLTVRTNKRPQKHVYVKSLGGQRKSSKKTPSFVWNKTRYVMTGVNWWKRS